MASLNFTDAREVGSKDRDGGSFLVQVTGVGVDINAIVYSGILNEDVDGAPNCYGRFPADAGLDRLRYATNLVGGGMFNELPKGQLAHPWIWVGVANMTHDAAVAAGILDRLDERSELAGRFSETAPLSDPKFPPKFPVLRADNNQFYVSSTALPRNTALPETDPGHWWDATTVQYGALTPPLRALGVGMGDFGVAIRRDTGVNGAFFFADAGSGNKIGEMSRMLFRTLFPGSDQQEERLVSFIVFPGSRLSPIANTPRPTLLRLFTDLSNTSNVGTLIDIMAAGTSFARLKDTPELVYVMDDVQRNRKHRAPGLDMGMNAGRSQTIATALRNWGFDAAAAERARAAAQPGLTIPPLPPEITNLKIP